MPDASPIDRVSRGEVVTTVEHNIGFGDQGVQFFAGELFADRINSSFRVDARECGFARLRL